MILYLFTTRQTAGISATAAAAWCSNLSWFLLVAKISHTVLDSATQLRQKIDSGIQLLKEVQIDLQHAAATVHTDLE